MDWSGSASSAPKIGRRSRNTMRSASRQRKWRALETRAIEYSSALLIGLTRAPAPHLRHEASKPTTQSKAQTGRRMRTQRVLESLALHDHLLAFITQAAGQPQLSIANLGDRWSDFVEIHHSLSLISHVVAREFALCD